MEMGGDKSIPKNICTNSFFSGDLHALLKKGLFVHGSVGVIDYLSHYSSPIHKFFISLRLSVPCIQGFGDCEPLIHRREKEREINFTMAAAKPSSTGPR